MMAASYSSDDEKAQAKEEIRKHPAVKSILHHFPDAEITDVRKLD
jgi:DNA polymerase-3 subunit gamma/tau